MKITHFFLAVVLVFGLHACHGTGNPKLEKGMYAKIKTDKGDILLTLEFEKVPITVANFVSLAEGSNKNVAESLRGKKYYDGIKFHRVVPNFVIQGGDPDGTGEGGPGYSFEDEFPKDENGKLLFKHDSKGILSMANSGPDTNGSQFFITHRATPHLDGRHSVFGHVVEGLEVVDSIAQGDVMSKVQIIRVGRDAQRFDAAKIMDDYLKEFEKAKAQQVEAQKEAIEKLPETKAKAAAYFVEMKAKAKTLPSGLKIYTLEEGTGNKPTSEDKVKVNYAGYFPDGGLFDTSWEEIAKKYGQWDAGRSKRKQYAPFPAPYNNSARLVPGFKEGLLRMNYGEKALLFIPSHLGYGESGAGKVIPPNADLVFEVQIVDKQ
jgi:cyclophilin family peptidyl-prolyl cis-trans isomerase